MSRTTSLPAGMATTSSPSTTMSPTSLTVVCTPSGTAATASARVANVWSPTCATCGPSLAFRGITSLSAVGWPLDGARPFGAVFEPGTTPSGIRLPSVWSEPGEGFPSGPSFEDPSPSSGWSDGCGTGTSVPPAAAFSPQAIAGRLRAMANAAASRIASALPAFDVCAMCPPFSCGLRYLQAASVPSRMPSPQRQAGKRTDVLLMIN